MDYMTYRDTIKKALEYALEQVKSSGGEIEVIEGVEPSVQEERLEVALKYFNNAVV